MRMRSSLFSFFLKFLQKNHIAFIIIHKFDRKQKTGGEYMVNVVKSRFMAGFDNPIYDDYVF